MSSTSKNLLVELFVEELPPKALKKLGEAFAAGIAASLKAQGLLNDGAAVTPFASPRRLAVHIESVRDVGPTSEVVQKLMPVAIGQDANGMPTEALKKRLMKEGRHVLSTLQIGSNDGPDRTFVQSDGKADAIYLKSLVKGSSIAVALQNALDEALARLPIPKVMSYQLDASSGPKVQPGWTTVNFVRPAHGLVALHGADVVPASVLGLRSGRTTQGHRFEAATPQLSLRDADSYVAQLEGEGAVIPAFEARRAEIARQLAEAAKPLGLQPIDDPALLDEVTALVERPNVLLCRFEPEFLAVPQECLILTMKANQKYFPLLDAAGKLTHQFLVVSNIRPADASAVTGGNERVVRPRLADAKFFFDQDRKKPLAERVPGLDKVVYHNKLGTQGERLRRVRAIARAIGLALGGQTLGESLAADADRAALLAKADLLTDMVGEFPELQGVMGGYYARHDGETEAIALAVEDHYRPRFAGDALPRNEVGLAVALADKLETLAGLFGIGQVPTGDKDPFALRRHALGVIRILEERARTLRLDQVVDAALAIDWPGDWRRMVRGSGDELVPLRNSLLAFFEDRVASAFRERGFSALEVSAVIADQKFWHVAEIPKRLAAVRAFAALPEAASLAAANKRVGNILKKSEAGAVAAVQEALLKEPAEAALHQALAAVQPAADAAFERGDYTASLQALAALKAPVDAFFDGVMVNADDAALRNNRLALLGGLHAAMNRVADLSRLAA
jgi:glycyl-tRNA synthetase beta chain